MQTALDRKTLLSSALRPQRSIRFRCFTVEASKNKDLTNLVQRTTAACGAALLLASPLAGPAFARPSDFIQSKPSATPGQATNVDKFPYSPSVSGQPARRDTSTITNPQKDPQQYSTTEGLGKALTSGAKGGSEAGNDLPSPLDIGPDPEKAGSQGPGFSGLNPFK